MAAASPSPNNFILLAVLGVGAYVLMRRAQAGTVNAVPAAAASVPTNGGVNGTGNFFTSLVAGLVSGYGRDSAIGTPAPAGIGSRGTYETMNRPYIPWEDGFDYTGVNPSPTTSGDVGAWLEANGGDQGAFF